MVWDFEASFLDHTCIDLNIMLQGHGLPYSGKKADLAARMEAYVKQHDYLSTPWNIKSTYCQYTKPELEAKLRDRGLKVSGTKALLADRMQSFDDQHPFPFLKLPAEIRNRIYHFAATQYYNDKVDTRDSDHINILNSHGAIWQPGLLRCNAQLRAEGHPIFYSTHTFQIDITHRKYSFLAWFRAIGPVARHQIRHLTLEITPRMADRRRQDRLVTFEARDVPMMDRIHASVADDAVVVWRTWEWHVSRLGALAEVFRVRDGDMGPRFEAEAEAGASLLKKCWLTFEIERMR